VSLSVCLSVCLSLRTCPTVLLRLPISPSLPVLTLLSCPHPFSLSVHQHIPSLITSLLRDISNFSSLFASLSLSLSLNSYPPPFLDTVSALLSSYPFRILHPLFHTRFRSFLYLSPYNVYRPSPPAHPLYSFSTLLYLFHSPTSFRPSLTLLSSPSPHHPLLSLSHHLMIR
jgi:hypothetical protein